MAYTKQSWSNGSAGATPINATRLNYIETGIYNAYARADSAYSRTTTNQNNITTVTNRVAAVESTTSSLNERVGALEGGGGGGATLSVNRFVNTGTQTVANNAWLLGVAWAVRPGVTNAGDVTVNANNQYLNIVKAGLYLVSYTMRDTANPSGQANNLNDLHIMSAVGGSVKATAMRFTFYASNQGSAAGLHYFDANTIVRLAMRQNATGGSFTLPDGVAGVNNGTDIGNSLEFVRVG